MALKDYVLPTMEVTLPDGGSFAVRGLSLDDVAQLLVKHGPVMETFFTRYSGGVESNAMEVGMGLIAQAPALVAQIIALAADAPEMEHVVRKMPMGIQQDALEKLSQMTFDASGGPGKFVAAVVRLIQGTTSLMGKQAL